MLWTQKKPPWNESPNPPGEFWHCLTVYQIIFPPIMAILGNDFETTQLSQLNPIEDMSNMTHSEDSTKSGRRSPHPAFTPTCSSKWAPAEFKRGRIAWQVIPAVDSAIRYETGDIVQVVLASKWFNRTPHRPASATPVATLQLPLASKGEEIRMWSSCISCIGSMKNIPILIWFPLSDEILFNSTDCCLKFHNFAHHLWFKISIVCWSKPHVCLLSPMFAA